MKTSPYYLLLIGILGAAACSKNNDSSPVLDRRDATFMVVAAQGNVNEITFGKLADSISATASIKTFARQMVTDHQGALDELLGIARDKTLGLDQVMDSAHKIIYPKLGALRGYEFDTAYIKGQVRDHQQTIDVFQFQADSGYDGRLKAYAAKYLPVIRMHAKHADSLAALYPQ
ncbi:DUF4142 domain-containing protein [Chitinophaga pendula]|uniref:DUF4142 domain-containing protein n=1 Tax=Chitinophaga TaxID=79328 RepID=UPI0012FD8CB1|nr:MULTISPECIES: DUF4142 domain-containing protein [Chitinophaga]UCJ08561.1 DUF4142 domain-containing protein [Chitinophaga pendula]